MEYKKRKNIYMFVYILISMIFLIVFTINHIKIYNEIKNYEYKQYERRIENRIQNYQDYNLETNKKFKKFNLIFELYLIISFAIFASYYEKNKLMIKVIILLISIINILYSRFIYSKIQMELCKNFLVDYIVCFSFMFFLIYEIIYLFSIKIVKKEYIIQQIKYFHGDDYISWFFTILNFCFSIVGSIFFKDLIYNKL